MTNKITRTVIFEIGLSGDCGNCASKIVMPRHTFCMAFGEEIRNQCQRQACKDYLSSKQPANPTTRIKAIAGQQYAINGKQYTAEDTIEGCLGCAFEKAETCGDTPLCSGADFSVRFRSVTE